jgi:ABC-type transport system, involved in lipoprotein release, permease component
MNLELFIARKIHFTKKDGKKATPPAVRIAMIGIALGLAVMMLSIAIIVGFKKEVRNKVVGFGSHIQITSFDRNASYETSPVAINDSLLFSLKNYPGIKHAEVFATKPGILKTENNFQGIVLKGVDTDYDWSFFQSNLKEGVIPVFNSDKASTDVIISRELCNMLDLKLEDSFITYFIQNEVRARRFNITGIYETGFQDYDKLFVVADIKQVKRLNGWNNNEVSGIELYVNDYNNLDAVADSLYFSLLETRDANGNPLHTRSVKELNPMIFGWLDVLDMNVIVILIIMMTVAGFTMISGLIIIILERTNMIGILKAQGMNNTSIRNIFLYISFFLIGKGMIWGNVVGTLVCFVQWKFKILKLDPSVYYIDAVPIDLSLPSFILLNLGALITAMLMMLGPSYIITKIEPAKSIRFE